MCVLVFPVSSCFFSCFPGFSLISDLRLDGLLGKVGSACEEFGDNEWVVYLMFEYSGAYSG